MYTYLIHVLQSSKSQRKADQAKQTLNYVFECLKQAPYDEQFRNQLIQDPEYVFPVEHEYRYQSQGVDYAFSSSGYLVQVMSIAGITEEESQSMVTTLEEQIYELHNKILSDTETESDINAFLETVEKIHIMCT